MDIYLQISGSGQNNTMLTTIVDISYLGSANLNRLLANPIIKFKERERMDGGGWSHLDSNGLVITYGLDTDFIDSITFLFHEISHFILASDKDFILPEWGLDSRPPGTAFNFKIQEDSMKITVDISDNGKHELDTMTVQYLLYKYCFPEKDERELAIKIAGHVDTTHKNNNPYTEEVRLFISKMIINNSKNFDISDILRRLDGKIQKLISVKDKWSYRKLVKIHREASHKIGMFEI